MIVTPEGLNVFPEDVERVLNALPGVRDSAVIGLPVDLDHGAAAERVHAVLVLDPSVDVDAVVRAANAQLADHQRIRRALVWPEAQLPRTDGTQKLKRAAIREWAKSGRKPGGHEAEGDALAALVPIVTVLTSLRATREELGTSSSGASADGRARTRSRAHRQARLRKRDIARLRTLVAGSATAERRREPVDFPTWSRSWAAPSARQSPDVDSSARAPFAPIRVVGRGPRRPRDAGHLHANHQSHGRADVLPRFRRLRYRVAPPWRRKFFRHFFPGNTGAAPGC
jgi:long-chain acyl-CoA synthetase